MSARPAISYIIPACNAAATVAETIRSVLVQTRADLECIVVDDGSGDDTAAVARASGDHRVRVVSQENRGLAGARNRGLADSSAPAACFLDADDVVDPAHAERMLAALEAGDHDAAACAYRMVGPRLEDLGWTIRPGEHDLSPERLIEFNPLAVGAVVVRAERLRRLAGAAPFDPSLSVHEDWECWLRLTAAGARWAVLPEALFSYRIQAGSMSSDLVKMHDVGLGVIARAPVASGLKAGAARRWTIRHVARAAARGDAALVARFLGTLGGAELAGDELELLAGSLKWALCQQHAVGPGRVSAEAEEKWKARAAAAVAGLPGGAGVVSRLRFPPDPWEWVAARIADHLRERGEPGAVIYGLGRNGRELVEALGRAGLPRGAAIGWIDDHPGAAAPWVGGRRLARLRLEDLTPAHVVAVTPAQREGVLAALRARGVTRIVLPDRAEAARA